MRLARRARRATRRLVQEDTPEMAALQARLAQATLTEMPREPLPLEPIPETRSLRLQMDMQHRERLPSPRPTVGLSTSRTWSVQQFWLAFCLLSMLFERRQVLKWARLQRVDRSGCRP